MTKRFSSAIPSLRTGHIVNSVESILAPWEATTVRDDEVKVFLADVDGPGRVSLYYLPARGIIVRHVPANGPWQTITLPSKEDAAAMIHEGCGGHWNVKDDTTDVCSKCGDECSYVSQSY
jgi:hypothetical protein